MTETVTAEVILPLADGSSILDRAEMFATGQMPRFPREFIADLIQTLRSR